MKEEVVAVVLLFLKINVCQADTAILGEDKEFRCNVPATEYEWHKKASGGYTILDQTKYPTKYAGTATSKLTIKSIAWIDIGEYRCVGSSVQFGEWIQLSVTVDGGWSSWNTWEGCTVTCGTGQQLRRRDCNNPLPAHGGDSCPGGEYDNRECTLAACAVKGGWSSWTNWEACTVTCGTGQQSRRRVCDNPLPEHGGAKCQEKENDNRECTLNACAVDGGWSTWNTWDACTVTCGSGQQRRKRNCTSPKPANGGAFCQGKEDDYNLCTNSACAVTEQQSGNTPIVVGTVIGVLVIVILLVTSVMYAKRRWHNSKKEPDYDITDMTKVKAHIYGVTHANHAYRNDHHTAEIEVTTTDNQYSNEAQIVERYDVSDLTKRYQNGEYFQQSLRAEFKLLNDSTDNPKQLNSPYEIVNTGLRQDVNKLHLDSSALDVIYTNNVSILLELPQKNLTEQFWTIVDNQCIENIILLANGNEKVSEFYPILDDILRINNFEIYLDSAERMNKNIMLLIFNLQNKTTQSIRQIRMFKTNVSEYPSVQTLCFVIDKASEIRGAPALIVNSKMADLSPCGVLTVCLNVIYAIKNGSSFSVLENARMVIKNSRSVFKDFDDYELCYKVIKHYLEDVHTYDCIE